MEAGTVPMWAPDGGHRGASPVLLRLASDAHLVALIRSGRKSAFETLYDRHHRGILAFCTHLLGDRDEAEDAVQHTFLAAYRAMVGSEQVIQARPWLYTIARNRCFTILRARREVAVADFDTGVSEGPATLVQRRQDLRDLVLDLRRLPDDQRAALVMAELGALSHDEIATVLEVPREKVKALVFQARESLLATRSAREADCSEIRADLVNLRGPALRRGHLRRHLVGCAACREYRRTLRHNRPQLAAALPVIPSLALRSTVLGATVGTRGATATAGGTAAVSTAVKLGLLKPAAGALVAALGALSAVAVVHTVLHTHPRLRPGPAATRVVASTRLGPRPPATPKAGSPAAPAAAGSAHVVVAHRAARPAPVYAAYRLRTARHTAARSLAPARRLSGTATAGADRILGAPASGLVALPTRRRTQRHDASSAPAARAAQVGERPATDAHRADAGPPQPGESPPPATSAGHDPGAGDGQVTGDGRAGGDGQPAGPDGAPEPTPASTNSDGDRYRPITTTRRTASWPKLSGRWPATPLPSPAAPAASVARPPQRSSAKAPASASATSTPALPSRRPGSLVRAPSA